MTLFVTCILLITPHQNQNRDPKFYSHFNMPLKGIMRKELIFGLFGKDPTYADILVISSETPSKEFPVFGGGGGGVTDFDYRLHRSGDFLWYFVGPTEVVRVPFNSQRVLDRDQRTSWALPALHDKYRREQLREFAGMGGLHYFPPTRVALDFIPVSDRACRVFFFAMKTKKIVTWETEGAPDLKATNPHRDAGKWKTIADERNLETIESAFEEHFYVFKRKTDYYFVTQFGELFIAPPPKKGEKSRSMTALWDDKTRPIVGIIEDADRDKVWLFAQNKKDAKLGYYFEMAPQTTFQNFDPTKLRPINAGARAKTLLEYLPLISVAAQK